MATLGHPAFRILIEEFGGCNEYYTEMINAGSLINRGQFEQYYINPAPVPEKIVWQLTGRNGSHLAEAAGIVARCGGIGVDLNMGCCAPDIVRTGAGIAWMMKPAEETRSMVTGVRKALETVASETGSVQKRLSVKLRLGDEDFTDDNFFSFCEMLAGEGVSVITLHPRTRKEKYRKAPRWEYVEKLAYRMKQQNVAVILNGGVDCVDAMNRALAVAPDCAGIMVGRAAVQQPWIFSQLRAALDRQEGKTLLSDSILRIDMLSTALSFLDALQEYQPPEFWKTRAQRFFFYYCMNFSFAHYAQTEMLNAKDLDDSRARLRDYFRRVPEDHIKEIRLVE